MLTTDKTLGELVTGINVGAWSDATTPVEHDKVLDNVNPALQP